MRLPSARRAALLVALVASAACGHVIAQAPPSTPAIESEVGTIAGHTAVVAARAARAVQEYGFTTRRFGSDSLWAWRAVDKIAARMRYAHGAGDSTRVFIELWGPCGKSGCMRGDVRAILARLAMDEGPPQ